jgi:ectoine hydroxylase-related dioxygenase (phytanoyl-CoA dioxygenase family)
MNDTEKYLFDVNGYLVVPDAIPPELVAQLNGQIDERMAASEARDAQQNAFSHCLTWRGAMLELIDNPRMETYLNNLLGPPPYSGPDRGPYYRLDHTYATVLMPRAEGAGAYILHGGNTPFDPGQFYRVSEGCIYNGLVVVAYNLTDVGEGDGGLGVVPGSHKANFRLPGDFTDLRRPNPLARAVCARAGSAVIFTEALSHGTLPWRGNHQRRTVFFKFNAYCSAFSGSYLDELTRDWPELSERQRSILEAPNSRSPGRRRARREQVA